MVLSGVDFFIECLTKMSIIRGPHDKNQVAGYKEVNGAFCLWIGPTFSLDNVPGLPGPPSLMASTLFP